MPLGPGEFLGGGQRRDSTGHKEWVFVAPDTALSADDVRAAGTIFDAEGREKFAVAAMSVPPDAVTGVTRDTDMLIATVTHTASTTTVTRNTDRSLLTITQGGTTRTVTRDANGFVATIA